MPGGRLSVGTDGLQLLQTSVYWAPHHRGQRRSKEGDVWHLSQVRVRKQWTTCVTPWVWADSTNLGLWHKSPHHIWRCISQTQRSAKRLPSGLRGNCRSKLALIAFCLIRWLHQMFLARVTCVLKAVRTRSYTLVKWWFNCHIHAKCLGINGLELNPSLTSSTALVWVQVVTRPRPTTVSKMEAEMHMMVPCAAYLRCSHSTTTH